MKQLFKQRSRTYKPRKQSMLIVRTVLFSVTLAFAAFTVINYGLTFWQSSRMLAGFICVVFALSALVTPTLTPLLIHARGVWILVGLAILAVFMTIDGVGFSQALKQVERGMTEAQYQADLAAWETDTLEDRERLTAARDALEGLAIPQHEITSRQEAALATYTAQVQVLQSRIDHASAGIPDKPERSDIIPDDMAMAFSMVLQVILALAFAFVEAVREGKFRRDMAAYEASRSKPKAPTPAKAKREEFGGLFVAGGTEA